jgi:hypothetical protein
MNGCLGNSQNKMYIHPTAKIKCIFTPIDTTGVQMYQSMIGTLQWMVTIGRLDIATAVMTMSGFRIAPQIGHIERVKRIYGYLSKMRCSVAMCCSAI